MPFYDPSKMSTQEIIPGCHARLIAGDRIMLSVLDMPKGSVLPEHGHPHEQAGMVLEGRLSLTIDGEEQVLHPGEAYVVPGGVKHSGYVVDEDVKVLDVFSPPREDYLGKA
jgi:quercetin dioxygenase-like cupin family protein